MFLLSSHCVVLLRSDICQVFMTVTKCKFVVDSNWTRMGFAKKSCEVISRVLKLFPFLPLCHCKHLLLAQMQETALQEMTTCYSNLPKWNVLDTGASALTHGARLVAQNILLVWLGAMGPSSFCTNTCTHRGEEAGEMDNPFPCGTLVYIVCTGMRSHQRHTTYRWASFGISNISLDCCSTQIKFSRVISCAEGNKYLHFTSKTK